MLPTEANTSSSSEKLTALWLSPDEWLVYSNEISNPDNNNYETENLLNKNISKVSLGAVTDVTDQFVLINIKGDKILSKFDSAFKEKGKKANNAISNIFFIIICNLFKI